MTLRSIALVGSVGALLAIWCCGAGDCFTVPGEKVSMNGIGYILKEYDNELVPFSETQPSPDGAYWRCKRADGSRRCFFAPPPST